MEATQGVFTEQIVRPTGLIDPPVIIRPTDRQVDDLLLAEVHQVIAQGMRVLVTTLTKKMAEALTEYGRGWDQSALYPLGRGHVRAHRNYPRFAAWRVRCADWYQLAARRVGHS